MLAASRKLIWHLLGKTYHVGDFHEIMVSFPLELQNSFTWDVNFGFAFVDKLTKLFDPTVLYQVRVSFVREGGKCFTAAHCQLGVPERFSEEV